MSLKEKRNLEARNLSLRDSYPAEPASIPRARRRVVGFAAASGARREQLETIRLAASEALTNVVLHAYPSGDRAGRIEVVTAVAADELWVLVADNGGGLRPREDSPGLGMGLALISTLSDGMEVVSRACGGTELRMRFSLRGSAQGDDQSFGADDSARSPAASHFSTTV